MRVIGFKRNATPMGGMALAVATSKGEVWVDAHQWFAGRRTLISRRKAIKAVKTAPYGLSYYSAPAGRAYEQTRLDY
jgi:hypothetical protein